jgi:CDP-diacylglycerol---glycerol-3-phosphate 3-phosphatidyltransferase
MILNLPTWLTLGRIALLPVLVAWFYVSPADLRWVSSLIFVLIGITDWLDGYLARRLNATSRFGAFLDPVADKIAVCVALALVIEAYGTPLITIPAMIIIGREITISALREWMADIGKSSKVAVAFIGKVKTTAQILAIVFLLFSVSTQGLLYIIGLVLLYVAALLTIWSMVVYGRLAMQALEE